MRDRGGEAGFVVARFERGQTVSRANASKISTTLSPASSRGRHMIEISGNFCVAYAHLPTQLDRLTFSELNSSSIIIHLTMNAGGSAANNTNTNKSRIAFQVSLRRFMHLFFLFRYSFVSHKIVCCVMHTIRMCPIE